jgi:predicted hydrocarbon binding protein
LSDFLMAMDANTGRGSADPLAPEKLARILRRALEEILGYSDLTMLVRRAAPGPGASSTTADRPGALGGGADTSRAGVAGLLPALEEAYGPLAGRGLALRIGRACFHYGIHEYADQAGVNGLEFRMLPLPARLRAGLKAFARFLDRGSTPVHNLTEQNGRLVWQVERCPLCARRSTPQPTCYLAVGLLQEALYWLSGGKTFHVEEVACQGRGDAACCFNIDPSPLAV